MKLTIVMASMNESACILGMIDEIKKYTPEDTEILLVDSSTDNTAELAQAQGVRVLKQKPEGHGVALKTGLNAAQGDIVITMDCDLTYPADQIPYFMNLINEQDYDIVSACRMTKMLKKEMPFTNRIANFCFALIVRLIYGVKTHDVSTGMFAMKKELAQTMWKGNHSLPAEIIIRSHMLKKKYIEVPIIYKLRIGESTLQKWRSGKCYLRCFLHWRWGWFGASGL